MKKLLSLFLCVVLALTTAFALVGCGPETPDDEGGKDAKYTVTFDSQEGSAVAAQTVKKDGLVTKPTDPTREGYDFLGWFKGTEKDAAAWNFKSDKVNKNVTLYAKWTEAEPTPEYTVEFVLNGGTPLIDPQSVKEGELVVKPDDPSRTGYTFLGWYTSTAATEDDKWDFENDTVTKNITLTAIWKMNTGEDTEEEIPDINEDEKDSGTRLPEVIP